MRGIHMRARFGLPTFFICLVSSASLVVAGCGQTTGTTGSATITSTPTATTAPTATPVPTIPVTSALLNACFGSSASQAGTTSQAGDILFTQVHVAGLAYP